MPHRSSSTRERADFRDLVRQYNQSRSRTAPLKPLTITLPPITEEMLDNEAIRLYNGALGPQGHFLQEYTAEIDENGWLVVDVAQDGLPWHGSLAGGLRQPIARIFMIHAAQI